MSDHSLGLYLLNTKLASLKGTLERVSSEIYQAEIALANLRSTKEVHQAELNELTETITLLKGAMSAVVREHKPTLDCE
jgi:chromosome segregation ATPase